MLQMHYSPRALKSSSKFSEDFIFHLPEKSVTLFSIWMRAGAQMLIFAGLKSIVTSDFAQCLCALSSCRWVKPCTPPASAPPFIGSQLPRMRSWSNAEAGGRERLPLLKARFQADPPPLARRWKICIRAGKCTSTKTFHVDEQSLQI